MPETQVNDKQLNDSDATEATEERNASTIEETVVGTPSHTLSDDITSALWKKFETISELIENRLLNIEKQIIVAGDSHIEKIGDINSDNALCFNLLKNRLSELDRQIEKDAIINFLPNQLVNKDLNGDFRVNKTVSGDSNNFQESW